MSNSVRPHRWQRTRLPRPWDSPGKNAGVGCHVLLQCMKVKSKSEDAQLCLTLSDPMDCSLSGSSVHDIFQARVLEWVAIAFSEKWARKLLWEESLIRPLILLMRVPSSRPSHLCQTPPTNTIALVSISCPVVSNSL